MYRGSPTKATIFVAKYQICSCIVKKRLKSYLDSYSLCNISRDFFCKLQQLKITSRNCLGKNVLAQLQIVMYEHVSRFPMVDSLPTCFLFIGITKRYKGPIYWHGRKVISFFLVRNFNPKNTGNVSGILKIFFPSEFNSHCDFNFWANPETTNSNFYELFDQSKQVWPVLFVYFLLCFSTKTIRLVENVL